MDVKDVEGAKDVEVVDGLGGFVKMKEIYGDSNVAKGVDGVGGVEGSKGSKGMDEVYNVNNANDVNSINSIDGNMDCIKTEKVIKTLVSGNEPVSELVLDGGEDSKVADIISLSIDDAVSLYLMLVTTANVLQSRISQDANNEVFGLPSKSLETLCKKIESCDDVKVNKAIEKYKDAIIAGPGKLAWEMMSYVCPDEVNG